MKYILFLFVIISNLTTAQVRNFYHFSGSQDSLGRTEWISYRLTAQMVEDTTSFERTGFWGIPQYNYEHSGYDRGHMANHSSFDFDNRYYETFNHFNIVPQTPFINRSVIRYIEEYERKLTQKYQCLYFVIRAKYIDRNVPDHFIREIYTCDLDQVASFKIENLK